MMNFKMTKSDEKRASAASFQSAASVGMSSGRVPPISNFRFFQFRQIMVFGPVLINFSSSRAPDWLANWLYAWRAGSLAG